jgi:putative ABC transport system permease protein
MYEKLSLPVRGLWRQPRRTVITLSAVTLGVIGLVLAGGFIEWVFWAMRESAIQFRLGHIQVTPPEYLRNSVSDPLRNLLPDQSSIFEEIEKLSGVRAVAPRLHFSGLVSHGETTVSFMGEGIEPEREEVLTSRQAILMGRGLDSGKPNCVLLGKGLAESLDVKPGDKVVLLVTTATGGINAVEPEICGIFTTSNKAFDDVALRAHRSVVKKLLHIHGAHKWIIHLEDTSRTPAILNTLRQRFADKVSEMSFVPWYELADADFYHKTVTLFSRQMGFLSFIIGIIIVLGITHTMAMNVMNRTAEIGTLMALGLRRVDVAGIFLAESVLIGVLGGLGGTLIGYGLGSLISMIGIPMPPAPGTNVGYTAEIMVTWPLLLKGFALAVVGTILAGFYPAWKASNLVIVDALRNTR